MIYIARYEEAYPIFFRADDDYAAIDHAKDVATLVQVLRLDDSQEEGTLEWIWPEPVTFG